MTYGFNRIIVTGWFLTLTLSGWSYSIIGPTAKVGRGRTKPIVSEEERITEYMTMLGIPQGSKSKDRIISPDISTLGRDVSVEVIMFDNEYEARRFPFIERVRRYAAPVLVLKARYEKGEEIGIRYYDDIGVLRVRNVAATHYVVNNSDIVIKLSDEVVCGRIEEWLKIPPMTETK